MSKKPFTPPTPSPNMPKVDVDALKNVNVDNPHIKKYLEKYRASKEDASKKVAEEIAKEKRIKRTDFLVELLKAAIIALFTLAIEHIMDIIGFVQNTFSS